MVKLLKQSSISLHWKNTRGQRVDQEAPEREPGQRHSNKISPSTERKTISSGTRDDRVRHERVDDRLEAG